MQLLTATFKTIKITVVPEAIFIIFLAKSYYTLLEHQPYRNHPPHLFCFIASPCEVTLSLNFTFCHTKSSKKKKIFKHELKQICKFMIFLIVIIVKHEDAERCMFGSDGRNK